MMVCSRNYNVNRNQKCLWCKLKQILNYDLRISETIQLVYLGRRVHRGYLRYCTQKRLIFQPYSFSKSSFSFTIPYLVSTASLRTFKSIQDLFIYILHQVNQITHLNSIANITINQLFLNLELTFICI